MTAPGAIGPAASDAAWSAHLEPVAEAGALMARFYAFGFELASPESARPSVFAMAPEPGVLWGVAQSGLQIALFCAETEIHAAEDAAWLHLGAHRVVLLSRPFAGGRAFCLVGRDHAPQEELMARARSYLDQDAEQRFAAERERRSAFWLTDRPAERHPGLSFRAVETLFAHLRSPRGSFPFRWSAQEVDAPERFDIDQILPLAQAWCRIDPAVAADLVRTALSCQAPDGSLPAICSPWSAPAAGAPARPFLAQAAERVFELHPAPEFLSFVLPRLRRYLDRSWERLAPEDSSPPRWPSAAEALIAETYDKELSSADVSAILLADIEAYLRLARRQAEGEEARWRPRCARLKDEIENRFWDAERGCHPDRYASGRAIERITLSSILPLFWPGLRSDHREALLDWVRRPNGFGAAGGAPAWLPWEGDAGAPPVRVFHQILLLSALERLHAREESRAFARRLRDVLVRGLDDPGGPAAAFANESGSERPSAALTAALVAGHLHATPAEEAAATEQSPGLRWMDRRRLWLLGLPIGAAALMLIGIAIGFALKTRPHRVSLETLSHLAQRYYREGRYDEARILYESVLGAGHRMPVAEFFLANILAKEGRLDEARERYRQLTGDPLLHQAALVNLGVSYYLQGLTNEALACFTDYVARYGENPGFLLDRARLAADLLSGQATDETKMRRAAE